MLARGHFPRTLIVWAGCHAAACTMIDPEETERKRVMFARNGALGKIGDPNDPRPVLDRADQRCQLYAENNDLGGSWRAWLSTSQVDAIDRIDDVGPWYRIDGETLLFPSKADLTR